jgi:TRAP-type C4-dicarboxylate transport system permease large subunit
VSSTAGSGESIGVRIGNAIIVILWPVILALYIVIGLVVLIEAVAVYCGWYLVVGLGRLVGRLWLRPRAEERKEGL